MSLLMLVCLWGRLVLRRLHLTWKIYKAFRAHTRNCTVVQVHTDSFFWPDFAYLYSNFHTALIAVIFLSSWSLCKNTILNSAGKYFSFMKRVSCLFENTLVMWRKCLALRNHQVQTLGKQGVLLNIVAQFWHLKPTAIFHWKFLTVSGGWTMDMAFL